MNTFRNPLAFLIAGACSLAAQAHTPLTRADVVAEYQDAIRSGDVLAAGDSGLKENELHPERYAPSPALAQSRTRAQVRAETLEAIRTGDMLAAGDSGLRMNELYPQLYAKAAPTSGYFLAAGRLASAPTPAGQ
jgi:Domain of unknown function (DUF4148)